MNNVNAIIERLEKAAGPDRELDGDIAIALGLDKEPGPGWPKSADEWTRYISKRYTASIDDAMKLLPENCDVELYWSAPLTGRCVAVVYGMKGKSEHLSANGITPAIALCGVALKATRAFD